MSLLLEALKKAELAKQQQANQSGASEETTLPITGTRSTDQLRDAPLLEPLMTRDRLPEVDSPLEFVPDQMASGDPMRGSTLDLALTDTSPQSGAGAKLGGAAAVGAAAATVGAALGSARGESTRESRSRSWGQGGAQDLAGDRESARRVFEAKAPEYNPRRPFYVALGALGIAAVSAIGYFWWELQPKSNFSNVAKAGPRPVASTPVTQTPPVTSAPVRAEPVEAPPQSVLATATPPTTPPPAAEATVRSESVAPNSTTTRPAIASKAPAIATAPSRAVPQPPQPRMSTPQVFVPTTRQPTPAAPSAVAAPRDPAGLRAPAAATAPLASKADEPLITRSRPTPRLDPLVEEAYTAFQAGEIERARQLYLRAAQSDSTNRDVQLGLAAVDVHDKNLVNADLRYQRLLELDPRDPHALAGQAAVRGVIDPVSSESRLKTLIAQQPESAMLNFALGNQLATQSRWNEAQQAYFKAFTSDPSNPDFAFNLAVSLDHMRQERLAANYYQQALTLADRRPAVFDRTRAAVRMKELQR